MRGVALNETRQNETMENAEQKRDKYGRPPIGYLTLNLSPSEDDDRKAITDSRPHFMNAEKWWLPSQLRRLFGI